MNSKARRAGSTWVRAAPREPASNPVETADKPYTGYVLPVFRGALKLAANSQQLANMNFFENYPMLHAYEEYTYDGNTPYAVINLRQHHFDSGTVRITRPGIYVFTEDIVFSPNPDNDVSPTPQQIASGQYPVGNAGAYHLGFFAAITVETNDVIVDLAGHTLTQSVLHHLEQRFYAHIELANAPFIPDQGPASFSDDNNFRSADRALVMNGTLGRSSHHGIHGNAMSNVIIMNITASEYEVAGVALNGATNSILSAVTARDMGDTIPVLSTYPQSRFVRSFLANLQASTPDATLNVHSGSKSIATITQELNALRSVTQNEVVNQGIKPTSELFRNDSGLYDANVYGIVLNVNGVVVNNFIKTRPEEAIGNQHILLMDVSIQNVRSRPVEIVALSTSPEEDEAYGGKREVGPVGDVLQISDITNEDGTYKENVLANAQLILAKYNDPANGTTNIDPAIVAWAENGTDITTVMSDNSLYYVSGGDSMGHAMKGTIGLFISAGEDISMHNIYIEGVRNEGQAVGQSSLIPEEDKQNNGADVAGLVITGSTNTSISNLYIGSVSTENTVGSSFADRLIACPAVASMSSSSFTV